MMHAHVRRMAAASPRDGRVTPGHDGRGGQAPIPNAIALGDSVRELGRLQEAEHSTGFHGSPVRAPRLDQRRSEGAGDGGCAARDRGGRGEQTAGRGRLERAWFSPPGNLYMSVYPSAAARCGTRNRTGVRRGRRRRRHGGGLFARRPAGDGEMAQRRARERSEDRGILPETRSRATGSSGPCWASA